MNEQDTINEVLKTLQRKALLYDERMRKDEVFKNNFLSFIDVLENAIKSFKENVKGFWMDVPIEQAGKHSKHKDVILELYEVMQHGTHVTRDFVEKTYGIEEKKIPYILMKLKSMPSVQVAKDGHSLRLYI